MLNGYKLCTGIYMNGQYFDSIENGNSGTEVKCAFYPPTSAGYIFGVRNSNSTTSTGQYNYYFSPTSTNYFGYNNNRSSFNGGFANGVIKCNSKKEVFQTIDKDGYVRGVSRTSADFSSNDTIIVGGLRNGSSITASPVGLIMCDIIINGRHFIPSINETTNTVGFTYQFNALLTEFIPCGTFTNMYKLTAKGSVGGKGYIKTILNEKVAEIYSHTNIPVRIVAEADVGYSFDYWEIDGNVFNEKELDIVLTADKTCIAHFKKIVDMDFGLGYHIIGLNYIKKSTPTQTDVTYSKIIDAQITVDSTEKVTSTITLDSNDKYGINTPVFLYDSRGNIIYSGIVKAQENNILTCREPLSIFDFDFLFRVSNSSGDNNINLTKYVADYVFYHYMRYAKYGTDKSNANALIFRRLLYKAFKYEWENDPSINNLTFFEKTLPIISQIEVGNLEEYLLDISNSYYVYPKTTLVKEYATPYDDDGIYYVHIKPYTSAQLPTLTLGTNVDAISNLSIVVENPEYTMLIVYNSAGTTLRGMYALYQNGEIEEVTYPDYEVSGYMAFNNYNVKIEMTDDTDITPLADEIVSSGQYNHKIDFTLDLNNNFYDIRSFEIGQRVAFYNNNKLYDSIVTALKYNVDANNDGIKSVDITLGKVRQKLTSKILLENKKKKK